MLMPALRSRGGRRAPAQTAVEHMVPYLLGRAPAEHIMNCRSILQLFNRGREPESDSES